MKRSVGLIVLASLIVAGGAAVAKLPPVSDEAKAKAAEAGAKTAHGNKVADFQLCKSMDRVAAVYLDGAKKAGKDIKPTATAACADPGPFVAAPPAAAPAPAATPAPAAAPAPAKKS